MNVNTPPFPRFLTNTSAPDLRSVSSQPVNLLRLALIAFSLVILVGCGGSSGGTTPSANLERLPVFPVASVENARYAVGGDAATSMTQAQIYQNIKSIADSADVLQMSDFSMVMATDGMTPAPISSVTCRSRVACNFSPAEGIPFTHFSLDDIASYPLFGNTDLPRFNVDSQIVMNHNGVTMVQGRGAALQVVVRTESETRLEYHSYGGWLTGSVFGAESFTTHESNGDTVVWYGSYSFGNDSGRAPPQGSATWMGAMVGTTQRGETIHGSARITINDDGSRSRNRLARRINVEFNNIRNLDNGTMVADMIWNELSLRDEGAFNDESSMTGSISGYFYGDNQEEVGGIFNRDNIIGAFGAKK